MIFSVSKDGFEWSFDFGPESVTVIVKELVQEMTICSQEILLAAWSLLMSQRQDFLNNHLVRNPVTFNEEEFMEMRDDVLLGVGANDMDTCGYQVSADLDDVEIYWDYDRLVVDAAFRPSIDTSSHQQRLTTWKREVQQNPQICSTKRRTKKTLRLL